MKQKFYLRGDTLFREDPVGAPLPDFPQSYKLIPVMHRDAFKQCYQNWILDEQPNLSNIDANVILAKIIKSYHDNDFPEYFQDEVENILKEAKLV